MTWHPDIPEEYRNQIVTGDALELAKTLPDKSCDLAFVDPPYWVGFNYKDKNDNDMKYIEPNLLVEEMSRIASTAMVTSSIGWMYKYPQPTWVIAWYKPAAMGRNFSGGVNSWEPILVYGRPRVDIDVITIQVRRQKDADFHSCPKPLKLMLHIIEKYTEPNGLVIDFMMGSGTTAIAAKLLGRRYIGFEINPYYTEKARERVRNTQPPLFVLEPEQQELDL